MVDAPGRPSSLRNRKQSSHSQSRNFLFSSAKYILSLCNFYVSLSRTTICNIPFVFIICRGFGKQGYQCHSKLTTFFLISVYVIGACLSKRRSQHKTPYMHIDAREEDPISRSSSQTTFFFLVLPSIWLYPAVFVRQNLKTKKFVLFLLELSLFLSVEANR